MAFSSSWTCGPNCSRAAVARLFCGRLQVLQSLLDPVGSYLGRIKRQDGVGCRLVLGCGGAEFRGQRCGGSRGRVEAAGGGAVALWLAHPARTTKLSAAATNRAEVALPQARSVIPTVRGMTLLHEFRAMGSATPLGRSGHHLLKQRGPHPEEVISSTTKRAVLVGHGVLPGSAGVALALQLGGPTARCLPGVGAPVELDDDRSRLARSVLGAQQFPADADVDGAVAAGGLHEHADRPARGPRRHGERWRPARRTRRHRRARPDE